MGWLVILAAVVALLGDDGAAGTHPAPAQAGPCVIDATAHRVVGKDATTLYTVDPDGTRRHFTVDPIVADVTNVGDYFSTPTDCVKEQP